MRKIHEIEKEKEERINEAKDPKHWRLSREDFKAVIGESRKYFKSFIYCKNK
jgi:hypothetical protein